MRWLRVLFLICFILAFVILQSNDGSVRQLNFFFFSLFLVFYLGLEFLNLVLEKKGFKAKTKPVFVLLLFYTIISSLVLGLYPLLRNLMVNRLGHFIGGDSCSWLSFEILHSLLKREDALISPYLFNLFVFSLASTAGGFNEIIELALELTTGRRFLGPTPDTAIDLLMNTIGVLTLLFVRGRKGDFTTTKSYIHPAKL